MGWLPMSVKTVTFPRTFHITGDILPMEVAYRLARRALAPDEVLEGVHVTWPPNGITKPTWCWRHLCRDVRIGIGWTTETK